MVILIVELGQFELEIEMKKKMKWSFFSQISR